MFQRSHTWSTAVSTGRFSGSGSFLAELLVAASLPGIVANCWSWARAVPLLSPLSFLDFVVPSAEKIDHFLALACIQDLASG